MSHPLVEAAAELVHAVEGLDWSPAAVRDCQERMSALTDAPPEVLAEAVQVLVDRLQHSAVDDGDGASQVAAAAGTLVERGAPAEPLARILAAHLPSVLMSARRFADRCLAELPPPSDEGDRPTEDTLLAVDERYVSRSLVRELLPLDRPGGCALVFLDQWVRPAVTALSRAPLELQRARGNPVLRTAIQAMSRSAAQPLQALLEADSSISEL